MPPLTTNFLHLCPENRYTMKFFLLILLYIPSCLLAQNKVLKVEGSSPNLYLLHTIAAKENFYSIGRLYNVSPKDQLAPFNKLSLEKSLNPGQQLKIPLVTGNFLQSGKAAADESLIPIYYTVADKEGLYRISTNHNKVPIESIKQWNHLKGESLNTGSNLIIGYLKVKTSLSALAENASNPPVVVAPIVDPIKPAKTGGEPVNGTEPLPPVKKPDPVPVVITPTPEPPKTVKVNQPLPSETMKGTGDNFNGGYFKSLYSETNLVKETGTAAVFKSNSGHDDGKYYCLHNAAQPGTIIKITNNANGKTIFAKVLDMIPDIKQNNGLLIRISNAGADILGLTDGKFECSISYSK